MLAATYEYQRDICSTDYHQPDEFTLLNSFTLSLHKNF